MKGAHRAPMEAAHRRPRVASKVRRRMGAWRGARAGGSGSEQNLCVSSRRSPVMHDDAARAACTSTALPLFHAATNPHHPIPSPFTCSSNPPPSSVNSGHRSWRRPSSRPHRPRPEEEERMVVLQHPLHSSSRSSLPCPPPASPPRPLSARRPRRPPQEPVLRPL